MCSPYQGPVVKNDPNLLLTMANGGVLDADKVRSTWSRAGPQPRKKVDSEPSKKKLTGDHDSGDMFDGGCQERMKLRRSPADSMTRTEWYDVGVALAPTFHESTSITHTYIAPLQSITIGNNLQFRLLRSSQGLM